MDDRCVGVVVTASDDAIPIGYPAVVPGGCPLCEVSIAKGAPRHPLIAGPFGWRTATSDEAAKAGVVWAHLECWRELMHRRQEARRGGTA